MFERSKEISLSKKVKVGFGFGHFYNDLSVTLYYSYILVFFNQVVKMTPVNAGIVILIGEIIDGASTLFSGAMTDKFGFFARFLQRKISWHIFGTLISVITFSLMFMPPPGYQPGDWSQSQLMGYYLPWVILWVKLFDMFFYTLRKFSKHSIHYL